MLRVARGAFWTAVQLVLAADRVGVRAATVAFVLELTARLVVVTGTAVRALLVDDCKRGTILSLSGRRNGEMDKREPNVNVGQQCVLIPVHKWSSTSRTWKLGGPTETYSAGQRQSAEGNERSRKHGTRLTPSSRVRTSTPLFLCCGFQCTLASVRNIRSEKDLRLPSTLVK